MIASGESKTSLRTDINCAGQLHPDALAGLRLFNAQRYFEAHEELEKAWRADASTIRNLYQGILQAGVVYLHVLRGNFDGAIKVYRRSLRHIAGWPERCRGVDVARLRADLEAVMLEVQRLGPDHIGEFDRALLKPVEWQDQPKVWMCDRCGSEMHSSNCKITCPNCGNRFDCSDLTLNFE